MSACEVTHPTWTSPLKYRFRLPGNVLAGMAICRWWFAVSRRSTESCIGCTPADTTRLLTSTAGCRPGKVVNAASNEISRGLHIAHRTALDQRDPRRYLSRVGARLFSAVSTLLTDSSARHRCTPVMPFRSASGGSALARNASTATVRWPSATSKRCVRMNPPGPTPSVYATRQIERDTLRNDGTTATRPFCRRIQTVEVVLTTEYFSAVRLVKVEIFRSAGEGDVTAAPAKAWYADTLRHMLAVVPLMKFVPCLGQQVVPDAYHTESCEAHRFTPPCGIASCCNDVNSLVGITGKRR
mgnify:CR=1 FL=1